MSYNRKNIAFVDLGSYWQTMRKICSSHLLTSSKVNSFSSIRRQELGLLVDRLQEAARNHAIVDLSSQVSSLTFDVICVMLFGKKFVDKELTVAIREGTFLSGVPNLGDFIPFIAFLDLQGLCRRAKAINKVVDGFLDMIIEERPEFKDQNKTDKDIMINDWAIGQDPSYWTEPQKFNPDRFVDSQIDFIGNNNNFEMLPFGFGRRGCPGMQLGLVMVRLIVAQLVHCFDWELPNGVLPSELDMSEESFGLTCPRAQNLRVVPICRVCI
ncbi:cytochrome P450 CYP736A12-like protein [Cucumis melo var. makuwa]|uniref:Cytochrome P450 CYP736A12-like protein n=1 Tax=Cucumis melo var. makuwa TaxID=1194695 RepID=A0A5D3DKJ7_CUCMM|nr:cytochrome P450 CYP736A12-like protein [Cucumis melo var. makuwa]TYK24058.1 cytochrome P450 CYP736A12-like protein [Cucumis melo var. makuwa]